MALVSKCSGSLLDYRLVRRRLFQRAAWFVRLMFGESPLWEEHISQLPELSSVDAKVSLTFLSVTWAMHRTIGTT